MTGYLANVMPHVAANDLEHVTEWIVGAAMLTTAIGVVAMARSTSRAATLPEPSQMDISGISLYSLGMPDSST